MTPSNAPAIYFRGEYTSPTITIWELDQPTSTDAPYPITTPALKLLNSNLIGLSNSLQLLKHAHTSPQVPLRAERYTAKDNAPEYTYLFQRRSYLSKQLSSFSTRGDLMATEKSELKRRLEAIEHFQRHELLLNLVKQVPSLTLTFLRADIQNLMLALGVFKSDYAAAHADGTVRAWKNVGIKARLANIGAALAGVVKRAKENNDETALEECASIKHTLRDAKAFKSSIDRWILSATLKRKFTGKPNLQQDGGRSQTTLVWEKDISPASTYYGKD